MSSENGPVGIGGWLILFLLGLSVFIISVPVSLYNDFWPIFAKGYWGMFTSPSSSVYHPLWAPLIIMEITVNFLFFVFAGVILVCIFKKHFLVPRLVIVFLLSNLGFLILDHFMINLIPTASGSDSAFFGEIGKKLVSTAIWVPYFIVSKRVKNTFVKKTEEENSGGDAASLPS